MAKDDTSKKKDTLSIKSQNVKAQKSKVKKTKITTNTRVSKSNTKEKKTSQHSIDSKKHADKISGYGSGDTETIISVDEINKQADTFRGNRPVKEDLDKLVGYDDFFTISGLNAGYGNMQILHDFHLRIGERQSICLIGPNGAGKSTVLHSIFGFTHISSGEIIIKGQNITHLSTANKLASVGIAYIMQDNSVFPNMTVEENLWMGGFLKKNSEEAKNITEQIFDKYKRLADRRKQPAKVLSGGERRLLEIARALVMNPHILLVDEPSIGLEPNYINAVFDILYELQHVDGKTIIMVEQNAKKGLEFADIGYILVAGELVKADKADKILNDKQIGRLFLGG